MSDSLQAEVLFEAVDASWPQQGHATFSLLLSETIAIGSLFDKANQRFVAVKALEMSNAMDVVSSKESFYAHFPMAQHRKMLFFLPGTQATLVPEALYAIEDRDQYFKLNYSYNELEEEIETTPIKQLKAQLIYGEPKGRKRELVYRFPGVNLFHQAVPWLETLLLLQKNTPDTRFHINLLEHAVEIAVIREAELLLYNAFPADTLEDKLYFVMFVSEQLKLNPHRDAYFLSGYFQKGDEAHRLFAKYIKELQLEQRPALFEYALPIRELPEHFLFKAYCTAVCA